MDLSPDDEDLIAEKLRSGEFQSREEVVSHALGLLRQARTSREENLSPAERARRLNEFFEELDRELPLRSTPLPDEAFDRANLYDDRA